METTQTDILKIARLEKTGAIGWTLSRLLWQNTDLLDTTNPKNYLVVTRDGYKKYGEEFLEITDSLEGRTETFIHDIEKNKVYSRNGDRNRQRSRTYVTEPASMDIIMLDFNPVKLVNYLEILNSFSKIAKKDSVIIFPTTLGISGVNFNRILPTSWRRFYVEEISKNTDLKCTLIVLDDNVSGLYDIVVLSKKTSRYKESDGSVFVFKP